jgi:hypothetical protein
MTQYLHASIKNPKGTLHGYAKYSGNFLESWGLLIDDDPIWDSKLLNVHGIEDHNFKEQHVHCVFIYKPVSESLARI